MTYGIREVGVLESRTINERNLTLRNSKISIGEEKEVKN